MNSLLGLKVFAAVHPADPDHPESSFDSSGWLAAARVDLMEGGGGFGRFGSMRGEGTTMIFIQPRQSSSIAVLGDGRGEV